MTDAVHEWPLGERVLQARGKESQRAVARRADIAAETLWQIEHGRRRDKAPFTRPSAEIVMKVARALDIPVGEALVLAGYSPKQHMPAEPFEVALARKMGALKPEEQRAVEILVDGLLVARGYAQSAEPAARVDVAVPVDSAYEFAAEGVQSNWEAADSEDRERVD